MQKRIYLNFLSLILVLIIILAVFFSYIFLTAARNQEIYAIRDKTYITANLLNNGSFENYPIDNLGSRITLISPDGLVLMDSHVHTELLENRGDRTEFIQAKLTGSGEAVRHSTVFESETYYYAVRLKNGNVLRISRTINSLNEVFMVILPALIVIIVVMLMLAHFIVKGLARQITEQHNAEAQRREFSANVSHELKTPLTTIAALSEMMVSGMAKPEDFTDFAARISAQTKRLINIINDIIRLSEFDENKTEREYTTFDMYELAKSVIDDLQEKFLEKNLDIVLKGQHLQMTANYRLIDELMHNLIENAIKYNQDGGKVIVDFFNESGNNKIIVSDTGIGISPEHQERIFERFYRVDNSRSKKTGGTGLGLSIVKHIVAHHKGRIELNSVEGEGTVVVCFFPKLTP